MIKHLEQNKCYKWVFPETCAGLIFRVIKINGGFYVIRYLNSRHKDYVGILQISKSFINFNLINLITVTAVDHYLNHS